MSLITVEPVVFSFVFVLAMLSPLLQQYIYEELSISHSFKTGNDSELCKNTTSVSENVTSSENLVQTEASHWLMGLSLSCKCHLMFIIYLVLCMYLLHLSMLK